MYTKKWWMFLAFGSLVCIVLAGAIALGVSEPVLRARASTAASTTMIGVPRSWERQAPSLLQHMPPSLRANLAFSRSPITTIPFWSSSFTANGITYPFQMVGTDPALNLKKTRIKTEIIPLKLTFANGVTLDGTSKVRATLKSPLFKDTTFASGKVQFGDAMQRAQFWNIVSTKSPNYHVILSKPHILPTISLTVPSDLGQVSTDPSTGMQIGLVDNTWMDGQLQTLLAQLQIDPRSLPIFLDYNTFLYQDGDANTCCIFGYHNAITTQEGNGLSQIQTYIFAAYNDPNIFGSLPIEDINALSHEVADWYSNPFEDNLVPSWQSDLAPQYGCSNALEAGDPLTGVATTVNGYHPQDVAFLPWFAQQAPSPSFNGQYTYANTYTTPAQSC